MWVQFLHLVHNLYSAMWSNMWAPSVWTLSGFLVADFRSIRRTKLMKAHHTNTVGDLASQIDQLTDRLVALIGGQNDNE